MTKEQIKAARAVIAETMPGAARDLTDDQIVKLCLIARDVPADRIKEAAGELPDATQT